LPPDVDLCAIEYVFKRREYVRAHRNPRNV
jgi:hypothetical protein